MKHPIHSTSVISCESLENRQFLSISFPAASAVQVVGGAGFMGPVAATNRLLPSSPAANGPVVVIGAGDPSIFIPIATLGSTSDTTTPIVVTTPTTTTTATTESTTPVTPITLAAGSPGLTATSVTPLVLSSGIGANVAGGSLLSGPGVAGSGPGVLDGGIGVGDIPAGATITDPDSINMLLTSTNAGVFSTVPVATATTTTTANTNASVLTSPLSTGSNSFATGGATVSNSMLGTFGVEMI